MSYLVLHRISFLSSTECQKGDQRMFINKAANGNNNLLGGVISSFRKEKKLSQRMLSDKLQLEGLEIDKNAIQRIECGKRFITDIEIVYFCKVFNVTPNDLFLSQFRIQ